ncbi:hypothetical protein DV707_07040 [Halobellus limi]|uniref:Uncharacterized protein n=2 Tax=Halobellus limi TaxID=699433 RepID=A0A1H5T170_9EURY|nr:hypothetical protein DV707_07040 [Halobellus limi]SEF56525.1 hypothetical protein SAMN04488133_0140 [Halobellus limi]
MAEVDFDESAFGDLGEPTSTAEEAAESVAEEAAETAADTGDERTIDITDILKKLLTADEHGPRAETLRESGLEDGMEHVGDGLLDWILDVVDVELGDTLGPLGKMGRGISQMLSNADVDESDQSDDEPDEDLEDVATPGGAAAV